jgi:hypothetical protein
VASSGTKISETSKLAKIRYYDFTAIAVYASHTGKIQMKLEKSIVTHKSITITRL